MAQLKNPLKPHSPSAPQDHNDRDEAMAKLIAGLNYLVAQSQAANLGTAARILSVAKEDMVHWAVDMNFHESARECFINNQLFGPLGNGVANLMTQMEQGVDLKAGPHKKS